MFDERDEVVKVATGTVVQIEVWQQALLDAGVTCKVVGNDLTGGLGSALPGGAIELWVRATDLPQAEAAIRFAEEHKGKPAKEAGPRGPVASDPKPHGGPDGHRRDHRNPTY
jgi:hypothetical protein